MKCVKKGADIQRVSDEKAADMVKDGWKYCPKKEWRKLRDANKPAKKTEKKATSEDEPKGNKYKGKNKGDRKSGSKDRRNSRGSRYSPKDEGRGKFEKFESTMSEEPPPPRQKSALEILDEMEKADKKA